MRFKLRSLILSTLLFSACAPMKNGEPGFATNTSHCSDRIFERLYFGSDTPTGALKESDWNLFLEQTVTPKFPAGLTVLQGSGQWLGANNVIVHEASHILEIVHDDSTDERKAINEIISAYKSLFQQEAVLELKTKVTACL